MINYVAALTVQLGISTAFSWRKNNCCTTAVVPEYEIIHVKLGVSDSYRGRDPSQG